MSDRDKIFQRIRNALAPLEQKAPYPDYDTSIAVRKSTGKSTSLWTTFREQFEAVHGVALEGWDALAGFLQERENPRGYCDLEFVETVGALVPRCDLESTFRRDDPDRYGFGISRASAAIAETGSLVLAEDTTPSRLGTLAPWTHIALVFEADIVANVPEAIERMGANRSVVFITGPSKTADVEGIMIEGVHGPGEQVACLIPAP